MSELPGTLYHYTCLHSHQTIGEEGVLKPGADGYVWLTDMERPIAKALGLTMNYITCDRTEYRYQVAPTADVIHWMDIRSSLNQELVWALELSEGAMPRHWFLSPEPIAATYNPIRR